MADAAPQIESPQLRSNTVQVPEVSVTNEVNDADKVRLFKRAVGDLYGEKKSRAFKSKGPKLAGLQKMADWMNSEEVKKMGVGATLVQGIEADRAKKQQEEKKKDDDKDKKPSPAPKPEEDDGPLPEIVIPPPLKTDFGVGIVSDPTRIEQEIGDLAQHDRSKDKPAQNTGFGGFLKGLASPIITPRVFARNFFQNVLFKGSFDARSMGFSRSMMEIARTQHAGLDSSIPFEMPQEILDKAIEEGRKIRKADNKLKRFGWTLADTVSGTTGFFENSDMRYAEKWFKENGKELVGAAKKTSLNEQTELGERFAIRGENKDVISSQVGETRYKLDEVITDKPTRDALQTKIKELVSAYAKDTINEEELLKQFNVYYHKEVLPKVSADKQKEITGTEKSVDSVELSSNILRIAREMKVVDKVAPDKFKSRYERYQDEKADDGEEMWNKLHFDIYLGKGKYEVTRGEVRLSGLERKLIHSMVERDYKLKNDLITSSALEMAKDVGIYGLAYVVGAKGAVVVAGKSFAHVGGMVIGSAVAGAREGILVSNKGKLYGLRGKAVNDFEQVSRETASGRRSKEDAKLRPMFEKAMVDQRKASELIDPISILLQKESLSESEQKQLLQAVAHAKARLTLTDLSTKKGKALFDTVGEISVAQNFIGFSVDNNNAEMTSLRTVIVQGGVKLATTNPELYGKLNDCQAVYEAQLRVGSFEDKVITALVRDTGITQVEARTKFADLFDDLGIDNKDKKSLEQAAFTLAKLVDVKAVTTATFALAVSPIIGTEMKIIGETGSGLFALVTNHGGEWLNNWEQVISGGGVPLKYDDNHNLQSGLSPLQKDVLAVENWIKPPSGADHFETIDGVRVSLPGGVAHGFVQGHPDEDALVDTRTGEVLVHMDKTTLFNSDKGELMVRSDVNGASEPASVAFAAFAKNGIHLVPDPSHNVNNPGGSETIFHAGTPHEDNSIVIDEKHITTTVPDNTHWVKDGDKWDLMGKNEDGTPRTLIDNATIKSNGEIDVQGATVDSTVRIDPGTPVSGGGSEKLFDHALTNRIVWGHNGHSPPIETTDRSNVISTSDPDRPGLAIRFPDDTFRNPDLRTSDPLAISSFQKAYENHELSALLEIKGLHGVNDGHIILKDCFVKEGDHFVLNLDPTSTKPIQLGDGTTVTMGEIARAILNEDELKKHPIGPLDSEFTGQFNVLKLGNNGQFGHILMGTTPDDKNLYGFQPIDGQSKIFLALHEYTGSEPHDGEALINTGGGERTFHATINADDIFKDNSGSTTSGYKIEYDHSANDLSLFLSGLRAVPIRENVERSIRGATGNTPTPISQSTPPQPKPADEEEVRKKLEKISKGNQNKNKLLNLKEIMPEQLSEEIVEGRVVGSGGIKYDKTTPDDEEEYEIYGEQGEGFIRAVLEKPYLTVNYIDEKKKKSIPVRANKGVKLEIANKAVINGIFMVGTDFYTINVVTGVFEKISDKEAERIRKLDWVWFD